MKTTHNALLQLFSESIKTAFPDVTISETLLELTPSSQEKFGHYQFNSAMKLSALLKIKPRDIAEKIVANLAPNTMIANCDIAGPGFINITLQPDYLAARLDIMLRDSHLGIDKVAAEKVIIDFSSPNTAKEMQVWHLRSTIIGDCLARLFEYMGYEVLRLNHVGDWGTAFGMLIAHMKDEAQTVLTGAKKTDLTELVKWYRSAKKRFDDDAEFKKRAQLEVVAMQQGDATSLHAWQIICAISRDAYQAIYDMLGVNITERGESFYNTMLATTIADLEKKGLIQLSDGAKCIFLEGFFNREGEPLPLMLQKSDGGYNYAATDMAALRHRIDIEKAARIIYVTDAGQAMHFQMLFKAAELAGYLDNKKTTINHVAFGLVLDPAGKKFRTRSGDSERLMDLLLAAIAKAETILIERGVAMPPDEIKKIAKILGINAIKYADLASHRTSDYVFSYDRMLRFEGNTAAFLMYAYVRVNGIKRKVGVDIAALKEKAHIHLVHPSEIALALHLNQFGDTLQTMVNDLFPHRLTDYLFVLAERFNAFFRDCRVDGDAAQDSRLLLCETVARVMHQGMFILGLQVTEKM